MNEKLLFSIYYRMFRFCKDLEKVGMEIENKDFEDAFEELSEMCTRIVADYIKDELSLKYNSVFRDGESTVLYECAGEFNGEPYDFMDYVLQAANKLV